MDKFIITGQRQLTGKTSVSGAKNVALKALVAACLTDEEVIIDNIPRISDFFIMAEIIRHLGGKVVIRGHTATIHVKHLTKDRISLDAAAEIRTSFMFMVPLLVRRGVAIIPNPGGCRIGARPIDRIVDGLSKMGVDIRYDSSDGYFHARAKKLTSNTYRFEKNSHTGTETLLLAAVLAEGKTVLENAAEEPEVDDLIGLLVRMGANITRKASRTIVVSGVSKLHGTHFVINPDRNEIVTLAIAAILTKGNIHIENARKEGIEAFLSELSRVGGVFKEESGGIRFFSTEKQLIASNIQTAPAPHFMTDWQGPWAVLMTKANGTSIIHETVYENRFGYVSELIKMGANVAYFTPEVKKREAVYNFNLTDDKKDPHAISIQGPSMLHNAVVTITDLRAGATLVLAALAAKGTSIVFGVEHLDRGYEQFEKRLNALGAKIRRVSE